MKLVFQTIIIGFISAALVDLTAWANANKEAGKILPFNFVIALPRWLIGAMTGAIGGNFQ